jgi:hypothetical protein
MILQKFVMKQEERKKSDNMLSSSVLPSTYNSFTDTAPSADVREPSGVLVDETQEEFRRGNRLSLEELNLIVLFSARASRS